MKSRLHSELQRLYLVPDAQGGSGERAALLDQQGRTRAMILSLSAPARWEELSRVWQAVQADLELPAPGIAVQGVDGYQLWFSLAEPVPAQEAAAFLAALRKRYLPEVAAQRIVTSPSGGTPHAMRIPPFQAAQGWSAFLAPDLAPLFAEEPWLDLPPGDDAQAELLSRLQSVKPAELRRAMALMAPAGPGGERASAPAPQAHQHEDARRFLLEVMNDPGVELHLRIDAAKALLPYSQR